MDMNVSPLNHTREVNEPLNFKEANNEPNVLSKLKSFAQKIFSYIASFFSSAVQAIRSLIARVTKKSDSTVEEIKRNSFPSNNSKEDSWHHIKLENRPIIIPTHEEMLAQITESPGFKKDPAVYIVIEMIKRGVGRACLNDAATAEVLGSLPNIAQKIRSIDFLRSVADICFEWVENAERKAKIMQVLEQSFNKQEFIDDLEAAANQLNNAVEQKDSSKIYHAESDLRIVLDVFGQAACNKSYKRQTCIPE